MALGFKDSIYTSEDNIMNYRDNNIKTTGGPNYDERVRFSEGQKNMYRFGRPIKETGRRYPEPRSAEEILSDPNRYGDSIKTTGGPNYDERLRYSEKQARINEFGEIIRETGRRYPEPRSAEEILSDPNRYGDPIKTTGGPNYDERLRDSENQVRYKKYVNYRTEGSHNIYDADMDTIRSMEAQVQRRREEDRPKMAIVNEIINNFPDNSEDLKAILETIDYRNDLVKNIVERLVTKFYVAIGGHVRDYSDEASKEINGILSNYLCVIDLLKAEGFYDASLESSSKMNEIMDIMHRRRKNGADVSVTFPVKYTPLSPKVDGVSALFCEMEHVKGNPDTPLVWAKYCPQTMDLYRGGMGRR